MYIIYVYVHFKSNLGKMTDGNSIHSEQLGQDAWENGGLRIAVPGYCDQEVEEVPKTDIHTFFAALLLTHDDKWIYSMRSDTLHNGLGPGMAMVHCWTHGSDRVEVWNGMDGEVADDGLFAVQIGSQALIVGCACGHPYVTCNLFSFGNSDGSSDWGGVDTSNLPAVISCAIDLAKDYVFNQIH